MFAYLKALSAMRVLRQAREQMYRRINDKGDTPGFAYIVAMYDVSVLYMQGKITKAVYLYIDRQLAAIRNEYNDIRCYW